MGPLYSAGFTIFVQRGISWFIFEVMALATFISFLLIGVVRSRKELRRNLPADEDTHNQRHTSTASSTRGSKEGIGEEEEDEDSGSLRYRHLSVTSSNAEYESRTKDRYFASISSSDAFHDGFDNLEPYAEDAPVAGGGNSGLDAPLILQEQSNI